MLFTTNFILQLHYSKLKKVFQSSHTAGLSPAEDRLVVTLQWIEHGAN